MICEHSQSPRWGVPCVIGGQPTFSSHSVVPDFVPCLWTAFRWCLRPTSTGITPEQDGIGQTRHNRGRLKFKNKGISKSEEVNEEESQDLLRTGRAEGVERPV